MKKNIIGKSIDKVFYEITKKKSNKEYKSELREMQKDGKELTKEEKKELRHQIVQKNSKACKGKAKAIGIATGIFALGAVAGVKGKDLLNPAVKGVTYEKWAKETIVNLDEIQGELNITGNKAKQFRNDQAKAVITESSRKKAKEKVEKIQDSEDVSELLDEVVAEYWEKNYGEEVKYVSLSKVTEQLNVFDDQANNGDEIKRYDRKDGNGLISAVLTMDITTEDENKYNENFAIENGKFYRVYLSGIEVEQAENSKLEEIAPLVLEGLEYRNAIYQNKLGNTSDEKLIKYKDDFEEKLAKHYDVTLQKEMFGDQQISENTVEVESEREN